jgi:hypothetical protein
MQTLTIQRIYQFSREQYLYLITLLMVAFWVYEAIDWYLYSLRRYGQGSILNDEITQLYLVFAFTPAVYAFFRSSVAQRHRLLRFALKTYLGFVLTISVSFGAGLSYLLSVFTG